MGLHDAVLRAKEAAAHAKPFMKLIDALSNLDTELRAAGQLETDQQATAKKKADLEAAIPALQSEKNALQHTVNSYKAEVATAKQDLAQYLATMRQSADKALAENHAKAEADFQARITALKGEISTLGGTISTLQAQKAEIEAQIAAIRKTFDDARTALHV